LLVNSGRICRCVELDPLYVDVIVKRFEAAAGATARLEGTDETFAGLTRRTSAEK
jgi:hypothetical protein